MSALNGCQRHRHRSWSRKLQFLEKYSSDVHIYIHTCIWEGMTIFSYRKEITRDHIDVSRQIARRERLLGWSFPGDCSSFFFFLLSSFLLVNDLWPNIEGYSIIIITATLCSFLPFFSFCLRWRFSEIFYFCSWDWVRW